LRRVGGHIAEAARDQSQHDRDDPDNALHADHFGGVPFFVLDAQFAKRTRPLTILGPLGLRERYGQAMEMAFPGSSSVARKFEISLIEVPPDVISTYGAIGILAKTVVRGHPTSQFYGYRIVIDAATVAYTGDTEWTDSIIELGEGADLLIAEAYFYEKQVPLHLSYNALLEHLPAIGPKRVILTHMSDDMTTRSSGIAHERAFDGMTVVI